MRRTPFIIFYIVVSSTVSCKKDTQRDSGSFEIQGNQKEMIASGTWKVSSFIDNGTDLTSDFNTYQFQFENDGSAVANSSGIGVLYFGVWNLAKACIGNHNDAGKLSGETSNKLQIKLHGNYHMDEISDKWEIIKLTSTEIWLKAESRNSIKKIHLTLI